MSVFYDFVDILGPSQFQKDGRNFSGKIALELESLTPVYVGSGYEDEKDGILFKCFLNQNGKPVIPGSTIKGMLRTVSQAVSYSCIDVGNKIKDDLPYDWKMCKDQNSCIVCNTFGRFGLKGHIKIGDFITEDTNTTIIKIPIQMSPNMEKREVYYKDDKLRGIKFYRHGDYKILDNTQINVEAVTEGRKFLGEIVFQEVTEKQLEMVCFSLGLDKSFTPKVGGNKSGFFGSCVFKVLKANYEDKVEFNPIELAGRYGKGDLEIDKNKLKLCEILDYKNRVTSL